MVGLFLRVGNMKDDQIYYALTILVIIYFLILFSLGGCVSSLKEIYLDAGQKVKITAPTSLIIHVNPDKSFMIHAEDYELGKNLIIQ